MDNVAYRFEFYIGERNEFWLNFVDRDLNFDEFETSKVEKHLKSILEYKMNKEEKNWKISKTNFGTNFIWISLRSFDVRERRTSGIKTLHNSMFVSVFFFHFLAVDLIETLWFEIADFFYLSNRSNWKTEIFARKFSANKIRESIR